MKKRKRYTLYIHFNQTWNKFTEPIVQDFVGKNEMNEMIETLKDDPSIKAIEYMDHANNSATQIYHVGNQLNN